MRSGEWLSWEWIRVEDEDEDEKVFKKRMRMSRRSLTALHKPNLSRKRIIIVSISKITTLVRTYLDI